VKDLARRIEGHPLPGHLDPNFVAQRLLEEPEQAESLADPGLVEKARRWKARIETTSRQPLPLLCAGCRFSAARGLAREVTHQHPPAPDRLTERLDALFLNRWLGLPLFASIMVILFQLIYGLGAPMQSWLNDGFQQIAQWMTRHLAPGLMQRFLVEGLWQGMSVVLSFFPIIGLFFLLMSLLEDSGYLARAAFLMDRLMHRLGLDGKAFISLLLGYGCNVPAVMGTRILSSRHNRVLAMLLIPFTLCSARLQVFVFFTGILFAPSLAPWVLVGLYAASFLAIVLMGLLLNRFEMGGRPEPFIMEMPPYRLPTLRTVGLRTGQELKDFLYRAATLIVAGVVLVWLLANLPLSATPGSADSLAGRIGQGLAPLFAPLGIPWQEVVALISGFVAKEIVIGALAVIHGGGDLQATLGHQLTPLQGIGFMVFTLLYTPCIATVAAIHAESNSWKVTLSSVLLGLVSAWGAAFVLYQGGRLLGIP
jgi:ferrous iron transport protein B